MCKNNDNKLTELHNIVKAYKDFQDSLNKTNQEIEEEQEILKMQIENITEEIYSLVKERDYDLPF